MTTTVWEWVTVDFHPAPAGWRVLHLSEQEIGMQAMAGWLVQQQMAYNASTGRQIAEPDRLPYRRVVVATVDESGQAVPAADNEHYWRAVAPGEPPPTNQEVIDAVAARLLKDADLTE